MTRSRILILLIISQINVLGFAAQLEVLSYESQTRINNFAQLNNKKDDVRDKEEIRFFRLWEKDRKKGERYPFLGLIRECQKFSSEKRIKIYKLLINSKFQFFNLVNAKSRVDVLFYKCLAQAGDIEAVNYFCQDAKYRNAFFRTMYTIFTSQDNMVEINKREELYNLLRSYTEKNNENVYLKYFHPNPKNSLDRMLSDENVHPLVKKLVIQILAYKYKKEAIPILQKYRYDSSKIMKDSFRDEAAYETVGECVKKEIYKLKLNFGENNFTDEIR